MKTHHLGLLQWIDRGTWRDFHARAEAIADDTCGNRFTVSVDYACPPGEDPELPDRADIGIWSWGREVWRATGGAWRWVSGPDDLKSGGRTAEIDVNYERVLEMSDERQRPQQGAHASTTPQGTLIHDGGEFRVSDDPEDIARAKYVHPRPDPKPAHQSAQVAGSLPLEPTYPDGTGAGVGADVWSFQHD